MKVIDYGLGGSSSNYITPVSVGHKCRCQNTESRGTNRNGKRHRIQLAPARGWAALGKTKQRSLRRRQEIRGLSYDEMDLLMFVDQVKKGL